LTINFEKHSLAYESYLKYESKIVDSGYKWTLQLVETLFLAIDHFCKFVNSFSLRANLMDGEYSKSNDLTQYPQFVEKMNQTLFDNKTNTGLNETVIPFIKNVSYQMISNKVIDETKLHD